MIIKRHKNTGLSTMPSRAPCGTGQNCAPPLRSNILPFSSLAISDQRRVPHIKTLIPLLPAGTGILFRDYSAPERALICKELRALARRYNRPFLVAGDIALAQAVNADGIHVPSYLLKWPRLWRSYPGIISAACHSRDEIKQAREGGAHLILLSPVFPTRSHPEANVLGASAFLALASDAGLPTFALGGLTHETVRRLCGKNVAGFAAISAFADPTL